MTFALMYIVVGFLCFVGSVPVILHESKNTEDCVLLGLVAMSGAMGWPLALPIVAIVGIGKWLKCF